MVEPGWRLYWLRIVTAAALAAGMLLSLPLWLAGRSYPTTPVSERLPDVPYPLDAAWLIAILALLATIVLRSAPRRPILIVVTLTALLCLWDQARWQPWLFQYLVFLVVVRRALRDPGDDTSRPLDTARILIAAIYFWSGVHKFNATFVASVFPWLLEPAAGGPLTGLPRQMAQGLGLLVPFVESGIGVGLLFEKSRAAAVWVAVAMHAFILLSIGPFGHHWDSLVWPWNVAMALFVVALFRRADGTRRRILSGDRSWFHRSVLVMGGVMPLLNVAGSWDTLPSWHLYSGRTSRARIELRDSAARLPDDMRPYVIERASGRKVVDLFSWSLGALNVEPYPEDRVYRAVGQSLCVRLGHPEDLVLVVRSRPGWLDGRTVTTRYTCRQLARPSPQEQRPRA